MREVRKENWAGFLGPVIGLTFVLLAILFAPSFSWESDALSDLGNWFRTDIGPDPFLRSFIFNAGLIIGGALIIYFVISLIGQIGDIIIRISLLSLAVNALFLAGVGVFSENISVGHIITALGFFLTIPISLVFVGAAFIRKQSTRLMGAIFLVLAVLSVMLFQPWAPIAVWEYSLALISTIGVILLSATDVIGRIDSLKIQKVTT